MTKLHAKNRFVGSILRIIGYSTSGCRPITFQQDPGSPPRRAGGRLIVNHLKFFYRSSGGLGATHGANDRIVRTQRKRQRKQKLKPKSGEIQSVNWHPTLLTTRTRKLFRNRLTGVSCSNSRASRTITATGAPTGARAHLLRAQRITRNGRSSRQPYLWFGGRSPISVAIFEKLPRWV